MTDVPPDQNGPDQPDQPEPSALDTGRTSSVRLRDGGPEGRAARAGGMDAANQSLADALRITYRLVQAAMVVLVVLFLFSGLRTIQEGQRGIKTTFGRIADSGLEPGPHFTLPYPVGEIVPINTGVVELRIDRAYFPFVQPGEEQNEESDLPSARQLKPGRDGSMITADQNIAHAQFSVRYRREGHAEFARNISPQFEEELVRKAVGRGVVQAAAETEIDDLLKDSPLAERAREIAQQELNAIDSGIRLESLIMLRKFAPIRVLDQFRKVLTASQAASEARTYARASAERILNEVAGTVAGELVDQIDAYERAIELGQDEDAEAILARIDELLESPDATGEVRSILSAAERRAIETVERARTSLEIFEGVRKGFEANPSLTLVQEWSDTMTRFHDQPFVQAFMVPPGAEDTMELWINNDPDYERAQERERQRREAESGSEERELQRIQDRYRSDRGINRGGDI